MSRWRRLLHLHILAPGRSQDWYLQPFLRLLRKRLDLDLLMMHALRVLLRSLGLRTLTRLPGVMTRVTRGVLRRMRGLLHRMVQLDVPLAGKLRLTLRYPDHLTGTAYAELSTPSIWKWSSNTS